MSEENNNENQEELKEFFPLDKILTASAKDYCNSESLKIKDYKFVGIHVDDDCDFHKFYKKGDLYRVLIYYFSQLIPENAEVVVDFQHSVGGSGSSNNSCNFYASGVALIPKEKKKEEN